MNRILTPQAQKDRDDFESYYGKDGNCSCHISPPCGSCTHRGNPANQEDDEFYEVEPGAKTEDLMP